MGLAFGGGLLPPAGAANGPAPAVDRCSPSEAGEVPPAWVLGHALPPADKAEMQATLLDRLFRHFAATNGLVAEDEEISASIARSRERMRALGLNADADLTPEEATEVEAMRRRIAASMILRWKINRALFERYGGRIIFQQFGPEPIDAYRSWLREREAAGDVALCDAELEAYFWRYFEDDSMHSFFEDGSDEAARAFSVPPWERSVAGDPAR